MIENHTRLEDVYFFAKCDIQRVWKSYIIGTNDEDFGRLRCNWRWLPSEIKDIILEIKHGVLDQGK